MNSAKEIQRILGMLPGYQAYVSPNKDENLQRAQAKRDRKRERNLRTYGTKVIAPAANKAGR